MHALTVLAMRNAINRETGSRSLIDTSNLVFFFFFLLAALSLYKAFLFDTAKNSHWPLLKKMLIILKKLRRKYN